MIKWRRIILVAGIALTIIMVVICPVLAGGSTVNSAPTPLPQVHGVVPGVSLYGPTTTLPAKITSARDVVTLLNALPPGMFSVIGPIAGALLGVVVGAFLNEGIRPWGSLSCVAYKVDLKLVKKSDSGEIESAHFVADVQFYCTSSRGACLSAIKFVFIEKQVFFRKSFIVPVQVFDGYGERGLPGMPPRKYVIHKECDALNISPLQIVSIKMESGIIEGDNLQKLMRCDRVEVVGKHPRGRWTFSETITKDMQIMINEQSQ